MNSKIAMCGLLAAALLVGGCKKKEDTAPSTGSAEAPPPGAPGAAVAGGVATYPNMTPQGGTVRLLQPFTVHQAADTASPVLSTLGVGTFVNLKGSFSNWMMIDWPSGVGQLSPGWIELRSIYDPRVTVHQVDAGVPVVVVVDAGVAVPVVVDAGAPIGRPVIKIPPKKK